MVMTHTRTPNNLVKNGNVLEIPCSNFDEIPAIVTEVFLLSPFKQSLGHVLKQSMTELLN